MHFFSRRKLKKSQSPVVSGMVALTMLTLGATSLADSLEFRWEGRITDQSGNPFGMAIDDTILVLARLEMGATVPGPEGGPSGDCYDFSFDCSVSFAGRSPTRSWELQLGRVTLIPAQSANPSFLELGFQVDSDPESIDLIDRAHGWNFGAGISGSPASFRLEYVSRNCGFAETEINGDPRTSFPCGFSGNDMNGNTFRGRFDPIVLSRLPAGYPLPPEFLEVSGSGVLNPGL